MVECPSNACGREEQNDTDPLREDPLLRPSYAGRCPRLELASQPTFSRLENAPSASARYRVAEALLEHCHRREAGAPLLRAAQPVRPAGRSAR
jgi:Transposase DDE domain group 1